MTIPDECPITELPPDQCAHCRGLKSPEEQAAVERGRLLRRGWKLAEFAGGCANCGDRFDVGQAIAWSGSRWGWVAECCANADGTVR